MTPPCARAGDWLHQGKQGRAFLLLHEAGSNSRGGREGERHRRRLGGGQRCCRALFPHGERSCFFHEIDAAAQIRFAGYDQLWDIRLAYRRAYRSWCWGGQCGSRTLSSALARQVSLGAQHDSMYVCWKLYVCLCASNADTLGIYMHV